GRQAGAAVRVARLLLIRRAGPAAVVKVELVADHQAAAARRLDVAPVPVPLSLGDADERPPLGPMPVEPVAAEAEANLVDLRPARRDALIAAPDAEQAKQQTLVGHAVEVVQLGNDLEVVALRVEPVGVGPIARLIDARPGRAADQVPRLPVTP